MAVLAVIVFDSLAVVPYRQLERVRRQTIVTRVALDDSNHRLIKNCSTRSRWSELGQALALIYENEAIIWQSSKVLKSDIPRLKQRISICISRGTCQLYASFLERAFSTEHHEVSILKKSANKKQAIMTARDYANAILTTPAPCSIIEEMLK